MDTKIEIKEQDPLLEDKASQNEREFFSKNVKIKPTCSTMLLENDCDVAIKTEIKSDTFFPNFSLKQEGECFVKHQINHINSKTITHSSSCEMDIKTQIDSLKQRTFLPMYPVMMGVKYDSDQEIDNKIEIKEDPWWRETKISSLWDDKEGNSTPVKSLRLCTEAVSSNCSGDSQLSFAEASGKNTSLNYTNDRLLYVSQEIEVHKVSSVEKHFLPEKHDKCNEGESYSNTILIHKGKRSHKCEICKKSFAFLSGLKRHNLIHEGKRQHKCEICERSFTNLSGLKRHSLTHGGKKPFKCPICQKSFTRLSGLKLHNFIHGGKKPHKCAICDKSFILLSHLKYHNLIHQGIKSHKCGICEKRFTHIGNLKLHNLIHEGKRSHKCEICKKSFIRPSDLKRHNLIHNYKKSYACEICKKSFTHLSYLKSHILIHTVRHHNCEICGKSFTRLADLKRHNLIHIGKKYKCQFCEKSFSRLSSVKVHNLIHEGIKPHKCVVCSKSFTSFSNLKRHILIHQRKKPPV